MSNIFEFAERFGFSPPIIFETDRKGFYKGIINFKNLFLFIQNETTKKPFDFLEYESTHRSTVSAEEQQAMAPTKDFLTFRDKSYPVNFPYETETLDGNKISLEPQTKLNKRIGYINGTPDFRVNFDYRNEKVSWDLRYYYNNTNTYAIQIECPFFDQFETILKLSGQSISESSIEEEIIKRFESAFNVSSDRDHIDWLYEIAPNFIIINRGAKQLLIDLSSILTGLVDEIGVNEEKVVIKILNALMLIYLSEYQGTNYIGKGADKLLKTLITVKVDEETLFERIYSKMNDKGFGEENFTQAIKFLYNIWLFSNWSQDINYKNETNLTNIAYTNNKVLGFYDNDYRFTFKNEKDGLRIKGSKSVDYGSGRDQITITKEIGNYHPFEPLHLAELPPKGEFKIDDKVIPAFYLKAFDDKAAWKNFDKGTWLALDIITTLSGVGNVLKFRHLTKLSNIAKATGVVSKGIKTTRYIKLAVGFVEIASGVINSLITLSNCEDSKNSKICKSVQKYLFLLEVLSIAGELRTALKGGLKKYADEIIAQSDEAIKKAHPEVFKHLDEVAIKKTTLQLRKNVEEFFKHRKELKQLSKDEIQKLFREAFEVKHLDRVIPYYKRFVAKYPKLRGVIDGIGNFIQPNIAEFSTQMVRNNKKGFTFLDLVHSGSKNFYDDFIKAFDDADDIAKRFKKGVVDNAGLGRKNDSEFKYIYHFLKNYLHQADEFIIKTKNIYVTCNSCQRELLILKKLVESQGKKMKLIVYGDDAIENGKDLFSALNN